MILGITLLLLVVLFIGTPVAFGLGFVAVISILLFIFPSQLMQIGSIAFSQGTSMNQLVAPLFVLMAELLAQGKVAADIFTVLSKWMRRINGGLAISSTLACTIFAALCGSSPATAAAIGRISIKEMVGRGYREDFTAGAIAAGGTLGIMIPPSIAMVIYGIITETSIAKLFIAGILPGLMLSALLCIFIFIRSSLNPEIIGQIRERKTKGVQLDEKLVALTPSSKIFDDIKLIIPPVILIVVIIGSLYTGVATPTEAAGLGAIGSLVLVLCQGRLKLHLLANIFEATARTSAMILFLIFGGLALSYVVTYLGLAQQLADWVIEVGVNRWFLLVAVYILWFILGCLMDPTSMIVLTVPFLFPTFMALGFDPIWLGVVSTLAVEIGMITPPVGLNIFVLRAISDIPMGKIIVGVLPFVGVLLVGLTIMSIFPQIVLYLPSRM
ncbi:MAG: TRAP transporter large permease [Armatimonadetes bacterium]|nr:TRAP transporter large permease [Armatimonadota bacterium]